MFHLVTMIRKHRTQRGISVPHQMPVETVEDAIAQVRKQMDNDFADFSELQNEDRTVNAEETAAIAAALK